MDECKHENTEMLYTTLVENGVDTVLRCKNCKRAFVIKGCLYEPQQFEHQQLPDGAFADPKNRYYPMVDLAHTRYSLASAKMNKEPDEIIQLLRDRINTLEEIEIQIHRDALDTMECVIKKTKEEG